MFWDVRRDQTSRKPWRININPLYEHNLRMKRLILDTYSLAITFMSALLMCITQKHRGKRITCCGRQLMVFPTNNSTHFVYPPHTTAYRISPPSSTVYLCFEIITCKFFCAMRKHLVVAHDPSPPRRSIVPSQPARIYWGKNRKAF